MIILLMMSSLFLYSKETPSPEVIANTISNYWMNSEFDSLKGYITNLYNSNTNYVPAIMSSIIYDRIVIYNEEGVKNKLNYLKQDLSKNSANYNDLYIGSIQFIERETHELVRLTEKSEKKGIKCISNLTDPLFINSNLKDMRKDTGDLLPLYFQLLYLMPSNHIENTTLYTAKDITEKSRTYTTPSNFTPTQATNGITDQIIPKEKLYFGVTKRNLLSALMIGGGGALFVMTLLYAFWPRQK